MPSSTESPTGLTLEQKYEILKYVTGASLSPVGTKRIEKDVQALIEHTRNIKSKFQDITTALTTIDTVKGSDGKPLNNTGSKFTPTWKTLLEGFEDLISKSTTIATKLGKACTNFEDVLLPVLTDQDPEDRMTLEEKRSSLASFLKVTDDSQTKGLKKSVGDLYAKLKTFAESFSSFTATRLALDETQIGALNTELNLATNAIEGLKNQIATWMASRSLTVFASLSWGLFPGFVFFAGVAGVKLAIDESVIIDDYEYLEQTYHWQAYRDEKATKIAELAEKEPIIQKCQEELITIRGSIVPEVCAAMGSFEEVWQSVKSQWESIALVLKDADGDVKVKKEPTCKTYIATNKSIYGPIGKALVKYGELQPTANRSGVAPETHVPTGLLS